MNVSFLRLLAMTIYPNRLYFIIMNSNNLLPNIAIQNGKVILCCRKVNGKITIELFVKQLF